MGGEGERGKGEKRVGKNKEVEKCNKGADVITYRYIMP